jgi:hypothetical protein
VSSTLAQRLAALPERYVDPDARADHEIDAHANQRETIEVTALRLAKAGPLSAQMLVAEAMCALPVAHTALSNLRAAGRLQRRARGWYELPERTTRQPELQGGHVSEARAHRREGDEQLSAAEAFFSAREPLPAARVPDFEAPGRRGRRP